MKCPHNRRRAQCVQCKGASICRHNKRRHYCLECGGGSICPHRRQRSACVDCNFALVIARRCACSVCGKKVSRRRQERQLCAECDPKRPPRLEHIVRDQLANRAPRPTLADNRLIGGAACGAARTRPDLCWIREDRIVHVEVDEGSHEDREVACELKKLDSANWGLADYGLRKLPTWTIRFNCSEFDRGKVPLDERVASLADEVNRLLEGTTESWDGLRLNVSYMYYHSKGDPHIEAARNAVDSVVVQGVSP